MKEQRKRIYKKCSSKKSTETERVDVLQALEEQRKRHQNIQETQRNVIREIPGFFYDTTKGKYFPNSMKKMHEESRSLQDKDCVVPLVPVVPVVPTPLFIYQQKRIPLNPSHLFSILFDRKTTQIFESTSSIKGIQLVDQCLFIASSQAVYMFHLQYTPPTLMISTVPQRTSVDGEITTIASSKSDCIVVSNTVSCSLATFIRKDGVCKATSFSSPCRCVWFLPPMMVTCGRFLSFHQDGRVLYSYSLPSEGLCLCGNTKGILVGCRNGDLIWYGMNKSVKRITKMKSGIAQCIGYDNQFVVCDMEGYCSIVLMLSYEKNQFAVIHTCLRHVLSLACCEDMVFAGCKEGVYWMDWNGDVHSQLNAEEKVTWLWYQSPFLCFASESGVHMQLERNVALHFAAI